MESGLCNGCTEASGQEKSDVLLSLCFNAAAVDTILNRQTHDGVTFLHLNWRSGETTRDRQTHITVSAYSREDGSPDRFSRHRVQNILNNIRGLHSFAKRMLNVYSLKLTSVSCTPFTFRFSHTKHTNGTLISRNKKVLSVMLKGLFMANSSDKPKLLIHVTSLKSATQATSCPCLSERSRETVEQRCAAMLEELSYQRGLIESQLGQHQALDDRMCEQLNTMLETAGTDLTRECHVRPQKQIENESSSTLCQTEADNSNDRGDISKDMEFVTDSQQNHLDGIPTGNPSRTEERPLDKTPESPQFDEIEHTSTGQGKRICRNMQMDRNANGYASPKQNSESVTTPKPAQKRIPQTYSKRPKSSEHIDQVDTSWPAIESTDDFEDDDIYTDQVESAYKGYSYSSQSHDFQGANDFGLDSTYGSTRKSASFYDRDYIMDYSKAPTSTSIDDNCHPSYDTTHDDQNPSLNFPVSHVHQSIGDTFTVQKRKPWSGDEGRHQLRTMIDTMTQDCPNRTRISDSVYEAMLEEEVASPRDEGGMDTVFCLDTSGSMAGEAIQTLKRVALQFIEVAERNAEKYDIEENIGLVTYGGRAQLLHHLTNDYTSLKQAVEIISPSGPSPIVEGLAVAMACLSKGGTLQISKHVKLRPRLVFITDGFPTAEHPEYSYDNGIATTQDRERIMNIFYELCPRQKDDGLPFPIVFVPVGANPNMGCLNTLAGCCCGLVTNANYFIKMANYQRQQRLSVEILQYISPRETYAQMETDVRDILAQMKQTATRDDVVRISDFSQANMLKEHADPGAKCSFHNIHQNPELPPLGSRVTRGPDWQWGNQDTEGPGTILNHASDKYVWVCWDNEHVNVYRYGHGDRYDVVTVNDQPRVCEGCAVGIGVEVQRGPDWNMLHGEQDGGIGNSGIVIRVNHVARVMVRWQNGGIYDYRFGRLDKYDVVVRDPITAILEATSISSHNVVKDPEAVTAERTNADQSPSTQLDLAYEWQRMGDNNVWESYPKIHNDKLMKAYSKKPTGTCLIQRDKKSFRISFKSLTERAIDGSAVVPVRRSPLPPTSGDLPSPEAMAS